MSVFTFPSTQNALLFDLLKARDEAPGGAVDNQKLVSRASVLLVLLLYLYHVLLVHLHTRLPGIFTTSHSYLP